jgi:hypothetical protein
MEWKEMTWKGDDMDRYGTGFTTNEQGMTWNGTLCQEIACHVIEKNDMELGGPTFSYLVPSIYCKVSLIVLPQSTLSQKLLIIVLILFHFKENLKR